MKRHGHDRHFLVQFVGKNIDLYRQEIRHTKKEFYSRTDHCQAAPDRSVDQPGAFGGWRLPGAGISEQSYYRSRMGDMGATQARQLKAPVSVVRFHPWPSTA